MTQTPQEPTPFRDFKRGVTSGRALVMIAVIAVVVLVIIIAVAGARVGEAPEFAMAAPAATPFFAELGLTDDVDDFGEQVAQSRLVRDEEQQAFEQYIERRLDEVDEEVPLARQWQHTMRLARDPETVPTRVALVVSRAQMLADVEPDDLVLIAEFERQEDVEHAATVIDADVVMTREIDGRHLMFVGAWEQAVDGVIGRLQAGEETGTLAATDELANVQQINRGLGLFLYYNVRDPYARWLQEQQAAPIAGNPERDEEELERDAARVIGEALPAERLGGLGIWVGVEETEMLLSIEDNPLAEGETEGGEEILEYLPHDTFYVTKVSAATDEHRAMRRFFRTHKSHLANFVDALRRQAREEIRDLPELIDIEEIGTHLERFGDVLQGHVGGGFFRIDPDVREGVGSVMAVLVTDPEEARVRLWQAKAELDVDEEWSALELNIDDETHPAIHLGDEAGIVLFRDNAAIYLNRVTSEQPFTERDVMTYLQRLDDVGTVTDHPGWGEGMSRGVSFSHTVVNAINVAGLVDLFEIEMEREEWELDQVGGNPTGMQNPLADTFIGTSMNMRNNGMHGYGSIGLVDMAALMVLTDFALERQDIDIAEELEEPAEEEEEPGVEIDEREIERYLDAYYRQVRLEDREPELEEFLELLHQNLREQVEQIEPELREEENRLILTGTDPNTGEEMNYEVELADRDLDAQPEAEEEDVEDDADDQNDENADE